MNSDELDNSGSESPTFKLPVRSIFDKSEWVIYVILITFGGISTIWINARIGVIVGVRDLNLVLIGESDFVATGLMYLLPSVLLMVGLSLYFEDGDQQLQGVSVALIGVVSILVTFYVGGAGSVIVPDSQLLILAVLFTMMLVISLYILYRTPLPRSQETLLFLPVFGKTKLSNFIIYIMFLVFGFIWYADSLFLVDAVAAATLVVVVYQVSRTTTMENILILGPSRSGKTWLMGGMIYTEKKFSISNTERMPTNASPDIEWVYQKFNQQNFDAIGATDTDSIGYYQFNINRGRFFQRTMQFRMVDAGGEYLNEIDINWEYNDELSREIDDEFDKKHFAENAESVRGLDDGPDKILQQQLVEAHSVLLVLPMEDFIIPGFKGTEHLNYIGTEEAEDTQSDDSQDVIDKTVEEEFEPPFEDECPGMENSEYLESLIKIGLTRDPTKYGPHGSDGYLDIYAEILEKYGNKKNIQFLCTKSDLIAQCDEEFSYDPSDDKLPERNWVKIRSTVWNEVFRPNPGQQLPHFLPGEFMREPQDAQKWCIPVFFRPVDRGDDGKIIPDLAADRGDEDIKIKNNDQERLPVRGLETLINEIWRG